MRARREGSREEILGAAAALLAAHGYHGMSMRELARATKQSLANLYNYFPSKDALLFEVQSRAFETLLASAAEAVGGASDAEGRLHAFIYNHVRYVAAHREVMRVLVEEAGALPARQRKAIRTLKERYFDMGLAIVRGVLEEGCAADAAGRPAPSPAEQQRATYSVFGMLNWVYGWYAPRQHGTAADVARTIHGIALCGLVARCPSRQIQLDSERRVAGRHLASPLRLAKGATA